MATVMKSGYLKKNDTGVLSAIIEKLTPKKWYVLVIHHRRPYLKQYAKEADAEVSTPLQVWDLTRTIHIRYNPSLRSLTFGLLCNDQRLELTAATKEEVNEWIVAFHQTFRRVALLRMPEQIECHTYSKFPAFVESKEKNKTSKYTTEREQEAGSDRRGRTPSPHRETPPPRRHEFFVENSFSQASDLVPPPRQFAPRSEDQSNVHENTHRDDLQPSDLMPPPPPCHKRSKTTASSSTYSTSQELLPPPRTLASMEYLEYPPARSASAPPLDVDLPIRCTHASSAGGESLDPSSLSDTENPPRCGEYTKPLRRNETFSGKVPARFGKPGTSESSGASPKLKRSPGSEGYPVAEPCLPPPARVPSERSTACSASSTPLLREGNVVRDDVPLPLPVISTTGRCPSGSLLAVEEGSPRLTHYELTDSSEDWPDSDQDSTDSDEDFEILSGRQYFNKACLDLPGAEASSETDTQKEKPPEPSEQPVAASTSSATVAVSLRKEMTLPGVTVALSAGAARGLALVDCAATVHIAGWNQAALYTLQGRFHLGDQVITLNNVKVNSAAYTRQLLQVKGETEVVVFLLKRTPHAHVVSVRCDGAREPGLGIRTFGGTTEIRYVDPNGLAASSGMPRYAPGNIGVYNVCNWVITELNDQHLNIFGKDNEVEEMLKSAGPDLTFVLHPYDFIEEVKKQLKSQRSVAERADS